VGERSEAWRDPEGGPVAEAASGPAEATSESADAAAGVAPDVANTPPSPAVEAARRRRAYREIRLWGDPALRSTAAPVTEFDAALAAEVDHQAQVLFDAAGAGLAAPQIGRLRRIVVYRLAEDPGEPFVRILVNPEIVAASPERERFEEGCLSMPGIYATVERAAAVTVRAFDPAGEPLEIDAEGRHASVLQHEIDHLDGILIPDRLTRPERKRYLAELRASVAGFGAGDQLGGPHLE
jgi:peptide deformylase